MDEINIITGFTTKLISKAVSLAVRKKTGCNIDILINKINVSIKDGTTHIHLDADVFLSEDISDVKNYIFADVLVPAIKKAISDTVTNGIDLMLYGSGNKKGSNASKISYWNGRNNENRNRYDSVKNTYGYSYDDIVLESRGEAEAVLARMDEIIDIYGLLSVGDLYDIVGITGNYTDNKYGWTDIRSAAVIRVHEGYMIKMPKAMPIN